MNPYRKLRSILRPDSVRDITAAIIREGQCTSALDVGCGSSSILSEYRPALYTVGVDAYPAAIAAARAKNVHDAYIVADVLKDDIAAALLAAGARRACDIVSLYGVIEHLPKPRGFELLRRCEQLAAKYVILETPNGFVEQGPESGNEYQRHLSGWIVRDFTSLGYRVYGTTGTKYLRYYMAGPRYNFPGWRYADELLTLLFRINRYPRHAFNLVAVKDLRGVPARNAPPDGAT